jgi:hypothetical protein
MMGPLGLGPPRRPGSRGVTQSAPSLFKLIGVAGGWSRRIPLCVLQAFGFLLGPTAPSRLPVPVRLGPWYWQPAAATRTVGRQRPPGHGPAPVATLGPLAGDADCQAASRLRVQVGAGLGQACLPVTRAVHTPWAQPPAQCRRGAVRVRLRAGKISGNI